MSSNSSFVTSSSLMSHPASAKYTRSGIGGAGNYRKAVSSRASTPSSVDTVPVRTGGTFFMGIGGQGNLRSKSPDHAAEPALAAIRRTAAGYYIGIGGAGNRADSFRGSKWRLS